MTIATTGMPMMAPIGPNRAAPMNTEASATPELIAIVAVEIRGVKM